MEEKKYKENSSKYFGNFEKHHHHHHHNSHSHHHHVHHQTPPEKPENQEKKYIPKEGDWECPEVECKNKNFARRDTCNRCGAPKPLKYYPVQGILILYNI